MTTSVAWRRLISALLFPLSLSLFLAVFRLIKKASRVGCGAQHTQTSKTPTTSHEVVNICAYVRIGKKKMKIMKKKRSLEKIADLHSTDCP